ncbi:MAG: 3-oxoacyl-ACP reductase FabG [Clostridiaceae bacterium]|nr:3-oxoacyl-ACP reductase FabG [Clostridiaceae bacterium]
MNKVAIITGASRGIGAATAKKLSADGWKVALVYNNSEAQVSLLASQLGNGSMAYRCDVKDVQKVNETVAAILADFGRIDLLVNNAGIAQQKLFTDITDSDWNDMISTNLSGAFYFSRAVLGDMIKRKSGKIINIASMWGETGGSCEVHYSAAKAGLIGMTKALAKEVALSGVTVNAVSPGVIRTDMLSSFSESELEALRHEIPLDRLGTPDDVANAVAFLASDGADYITGQVLSVNGGLVI